MSFGERVESAFAGIVGARVDPVGEAAAEARERAFRDARRYPELRLEDLVELDEAAELYSDGVNVLQWMPTQSDPTMHKTIGFVAFDEGPRYLRIPADGPATLASWERRRDDARRAAETAAEERRRELEAAPFVPVTIDLVEGRPMPTLRAAGELVWTYGTIDVVDGRLVVGYRLIDPHVLPMFRDAVRVLFVAESVVVELLERGEELPDRPISPAGAVIVLDAGELVPEDAPPGRRSRPRARSGTAAGALAQ